MQSFFSNLMPWVGGFAVACGLLLSVLVYKNNPKSWTNKIFCALGIVVVLWTMSMYAAQTFTSPPWGLFLARLTLFFAAPMNALFFLFAHALPQSRLALGKRTIFSLVVATLVVMGIALSPWAFVALDVADGLLVAVPGPGMPIFGIFSVLLNVASVFVIYRNLKKSTGKERLQLQFVMTGVLVMFGFIIATVFLPVVAFNNASLVPLVPLYVLFFVGMTAYAIIRHRLLEIRLILARAVAFSFLLMLVAGVYALVFLLGFRKIFGIEIETGPFAAFLGMTFIIIIMFRSVQDGIGRLTNKIFFKGRYESGELIANLTDSMVASVDLDSMAQKILAILLREMHITKGAFLVLENHIIADVKSIGYQDSILQSQELEALFHQRRGTADFFLFEDIDEKDPLKEIFRRLDIAFAIPVKVENTEVAILILGPKRSGEVYFERDIDTLLIFAAEAGIAIQNAKSFSEIKKFSKELEKRVAERTAELQETQERELAKAKEVVQLKDEFVFLAAHELRTPVTAIKGFLELTSESKTKFPKDVQDNLIAMAQASEHLNQLIGDLLEIARSDSGTLSVNAEPHEFTFILRETLHELSSLTKEKNILVKTNIESFPPVLCDAAKLKEVLLNLLGNAVKYNKDGGTIEVSAYRHPGENFFICEIRDTGYGIPKTQQARIFQKFFRAAAPGTRDVLGTGLGLFITRVLVEKMSGKITFSSVEGEGSTFAFTLPLAVDAAGVSRTKP